MVSTENFSHSLHAESPPSELISPRFLLVLDCDSTLIEEEVIDVLAEQAGSFSTVKSITEKAMRGELDFTESLKKRVLTLSGCEQELLTTSVSRLTVTRGARELIAEVSKRNGILGVVSGGFHEILDPLAHRLGINMTKANRLEVEGNKLTGKTIGPIVDAAMKAETLRAWAEQNGLDLSQTIAVGDGANDLEMMAVAGLSIAFNAKNIVKERANLSIESHDLSDIIPLLPFG